MSGFELRTSGNTDVATLQSETEPSPLPNVTYYNEDNILSRGNE